jgi:hypothetical protein
MLTGIISTGIKWPEPESDYSSPSSADVEMYLHSSIRLRGLQRDNMTATFTNK